MADAAILIKQSSSDLSCSDFSRNHRDRVMELMLSRDGVVEQLFSNNTSVNGAISTQNKMRATNALTVGAGAVESTSAAASGATAAASIPTSFDIGLGRENSSVFAATGETVVSTTTVTAVS